jgi:hypothetical protein
MRRLLLLFLLCSPATAGELLFLNPNNANTQRARIEISTPEGGVCRKTAGRSTELIVGGSYGRGEVIAGGNRIENETIINNGSELTGGVPTVGVALRIPLGQEDVGDCLGMIEVLDVQTRVQVAEDMFEKGLITQEQLETVASRAYAILKKF